MNYSLRILFTLIIAIALTIGLRELFVKSARQWFLDFQKNESAFNIDSTNYDLLLLGSSRMLYNADPCVLDSVAGCSSFNLGQNGGRLPEQTACLKGYLAANLPPKVVCVALDLHMVDSKINFTFYPYYLTSTKNSAIYSQLADDGIKVWLYKYAPFLDITEYGDYFKGAAIKVRMRQSELEDGDFYCKGFKSNTADTITIAAIRRAEHITIRYSIQPEALKALNELMVICKKKNIELVCVYAPEYNSMVTHSVSNKDSIFSVYNNALRDAHIPFIRFDSIPSLNYSRRLFRDPGHLNREGARQYSKALGDTLRQRYFHTAAGF